MQTVDHRFFVMHSSDLGHGLRIWPYNPPPNRAHQVISSHFRSRKNPHFPTPTPACHVKKATRFTFIDLSLGLLPSQYPTRATGCNQDSGSVIGDMATTLQAIHQDDTICIIAYGPSYLSHIYANTRHDFLELQCCVYVCIYICTSSMQGPDSHIPVEQRGQWRTSHRPADEEPGKPSKVSKNPQNVPIRYHLVNSSQSCFCVAKFLPLW